METTWTKIEGGVCAAKGFKAKKRVVTESVSTIADGIAVKQPGENTFDLCSKYVDDVVTVSDDEISAAILALMEQHKLVTEGAGATAVAAAAS